MSKLNPLCKLCGTPCRNRFCSRSCSANFNNKKREYSTKSRNKISKSMKGRTYDRGNHSKSCKVFLKTCTICNNQFYTSAKKKANSTCSYECKIEAQVNRRKYRNGVRKLTEYYCQYRKETVWLESSWEVQIAQALDRANIEWFRPSPIRWIDSNGKVRLYFPDFYLPNFALYVDPKNPYCMEQDREKIKAIKDQVFLICGEVTAVLHALSRQTGRKMI